MNWFLAIERMVPAPLLESGAGLARASSKAHFNGPALPVIVILSRREESLREAPVRNEES